MIRLTFPQLTEERRKDLCKDIKKLGEDAKVAVRSIRRDANDKIKNMKKEGELTEDDVKIFDKDIQKLTDKYTDLIDNEVSAKKRRYFPSKLGQTVIFNFKFQVVEQSRFMRDCSKSIYINALPSKQIVLNFSPKTEGMI